MAKIRVASDSICLQITTITATELGPNEAQSERLAHLTHTALFKPAIVAADCSYQSQHVSKKKTCRFLLASEDHTVSLVQQNVVWTREEALANIAAIEIVELPMSDREQAIETEFDVKESKYTKELF